MPDVAAAPLADEITALFEGSPEPRRTVCLIQFYRGKIEERQKIGRDASGLIATYNELLDRYDEIDHKPPLFDIEHPYT